jgi:hypothetical protein
LKICKCTQYEFPILKNQNIRRYKIKLKVHLSLEAFNVAPTSLQDRFLEWPDQNVRREPGDYLTTWSLVNCIPHKV